MALYTVAINGTVKAADLNQIVNALNGTVGVPMRFDAVSDGGQYAVTIRNQGPGGLALIVQDASGATLFQAAGSAVRAAVGGTLQDLVGVSATQTLSGKTLSSPTINGPTFGGVVQLTNAILREAQQTIASAATLTLPDTGNTFEVTGNTNITRIDIKPAGTRVSLRFLGALSLIHNTVAPNNLDLGGVDIAVIAGQVLDLLSDGTNWHAKKMGPMVKKGTYVGDGLTRSIAIGFTPDWVLIHCVEDHRVWFVPSTVESIHLSGSSSVQTAVKITTNGFTVGTTNVQANLTGQNYDYLAIRAG